MPANKARTQQFPEAMRKFFNKMDHEFLGPQHLIQTNHIYNQWFEIQGNSRHMFN